MAGKAFIINIRHNGMAWTIRGEYLAPIMSEFVERLDSKCGMRNTECGELNGVKIIKSNRARTTLSAPFVNGQRVIVKRYHSKGWFERIKYLFLPSRAKAEWDTMNALLDKGISTCVPLAYGERRRWGFLLDGSLIVKEIPDCLSFQAYIKQHCSGMLSKNKILLKRELLKKLANFIRDIHEKNIEHKDFHGGNILVTETDSGDLVFYLIDLHKARVCKGLPLRRKINNLALQCDIPGFPFSRTDCLRLIKYYNNFRDRDDFKSFASKALKRVEILRHRRLKSTTRWCLKSSNVFAIYKAKGVRIYYRKEYNLAGILDLLKSIEHGQTGLSMPPIYRVLKRSSKSVVFLEEIPFGEIPKKVEDPPSFGRVVVKYNFCRGFFDMLKKTFLGTRCRRAWIASNGLTVRGIPTPQAIALVEYKSLGFTRDNLLLTEYIDGLLSVNDYILSHFSNGFNFNRKKFFTETLARLVRLFHDSGIYHSDLSGRNILVKEDPQGNWKMFITDLDAVSLRRKLTLKRRLKNLAQINDCPDCITNADRMRFFKTYFRGIPPKAHEYISKIVKLTTVRRQRRKRSNTDKQVCPCHPA